MSSLNPGDERRLHTAVSRYLRSGVRSTQEVSGYLTRRGLSAPRAAALIRAYQAQGVLDDRAAARLCAAHWARQGYADAAIRLKLLAKGLDEPLIQDILTQLRRDTDDEARAHRLVAQRLRRMAGRRAPARLARTLAARGFGSELIERILQAFHPPPDSDFDAER